MKGNLQYFFMKVPLPCVKREYCDSTTMPNLLFCHESTVQLSGTDLFSEAFNASKQAAINDLFSDAFNASKQAAINDPTVILTVS